MVFLSYASLYWISSVILTTSTIFIGGAKVVTHRYNPRQFWHLIERYRVRITRKKKSTLVDSMHSSFIVSSTV